jgi:hypothetical protein
MEQDMTHETSIDYGEIMIHEPRLLLVTSLGAHNDGTIGPKGTPEENAALAEYMAAEVGRPEYSKPPSTRWVCVDGRVSARKMERTDNTQADPQTAGGLPLTEVSIAYMTSKAPVPLSAAVPAATRKTIADGQQAVVHGDTHKHYAGCGCNAGQRMILRRNAANIDIITPIAWMFAERLGLDKHMEVRDVTELIVTGGEHAGNNGLWDLTPEEKTQAILDNGGEYEELIEEHTEFLTGVQIGETAFDEAAFIRDHTDEHGAALRAFGASFGLLQKHYFALAQKNGTSLHEAAEQTMAAWLHNLGTAKCLSNDAMRAAVYA